ncbi:hypothetical protein [Epibacterium sp. Ofav1-8]|uniref:hypothetical protein n=1 Tax=Epibacterium sp. Ofav1-8 TaxID=2917735 RepID=UPI001EF49A9C|nr:hypothetical protein [Epibacterium sp. Ofav1-8]MCG7623207.1 hypothetical protein [Epibacterium sp. Ofav1-8]
MGLHSYIAQAIFILSFASASIADESPIRWDDFVTSGSVAVLEQNLLRPIWRQSRDFTAIRSKQTSYTIGVDEVLYIPVWNETPEGAQIGIDWRLENKSPGIVSSVMVDSFRPTHRSNQLSLLFKTDSKLAPYFSRPATPQIGCETRHGEKAQNLIIENVVLLSQPTAYICIQGRSIGETVIIVGERLSTINRQQYYKLASTGPNHSTGNSYVNPNLSLQIDIRVVAEAASNPKELAYAAMEIAGHFIVRPINASFEILPCKGLSVDVIAGTSLSLKPIASMDCFFDYDELKAPNKDFPPYFDDAAINVLVKQERNVSSGGQSAKIIKSASAFTHIIPRVNSGTNLTAWAKLSCPTVLYPGVRFGCRMKLADSLGNNPLDYDSRIEAASLTNGPFSYKGRAPINQTIICFEVDATAPDLSSFAISGLTIPGFRFKSQQIWIDARAERAVSVPYSDDCQAAQLP